MPGGSFYQSKEWRMLRAAVLKRDPVCVVPGCASHSVVADHIIERRKGGPDTLANLRGLCAMHHNQRSRGGEPGRRGCDADGWPSVAR
jgi:5-methylcytosine-specific restriction protein A